MMAKTKSKYPTSFDTYEEFERIFNSIPEYDRLEWAESLDPKLLQMKMDNGMTVAHVLAKSGTLPEKFITEELLRIRTDNGWTVAHSLAESGTLHKELILSPERRITEELLRMKYKYRYWLIPHFTDPIPYLF